MREIVLDTETTGLSVGQGDRIVEIGAVELINLVPTGKTFHAYIKPDRSISDGARNITGLTDAFLFSKPRFAEIAAAFINFIGDSVMVIHNASFDIGFINAEFARINVPAVNPERVVDTLAIARKRFPGAQASLDALCRRFAIDLSGREKHGALLDAELLAQVYLELKGGPQPTFSLHFAAAEDDLAEAHGPVVWNRQNRSRLTKEEADRHDAFIAGLGENSVWATLRSGAKN